MGPQGDARRVDNFVRCVRGGGVEPGSRQPPRVRNAYPRKVRVLENTAVSAAGRGQATGGDFPSRFVERLDKDGDGRVSRAEFDGPPERFDFHDANGDGQLTPDELRPTGPGGGFRPRQGGGAGGLRGPGPGGPNGARNLVERIMGLDRDGDGKLAKEELPDRLQRAFERIDTNGDGAIDRAEVEAVAERFAGRGDRERGPGGRPRPGGPGPEPE